MSEQEKAIIQECVDTLGNIRVPAILTMEISTQILAVMKRLSDVKNGMIKEDKKQEEQKE